METFFCHYKGKKLLFFTLPPPFYSFTPENLHLLPFALPILIIQLPKSHRIVRGLWASPADFQKVITFFSMHLCLAWKCACFLHCWIILHHLNRVYTYLDLFLFFVYEYLPTCMSVSHACAWC